MLALIFAVVTGQSHKEQLGARSDVCEMESCLAASVHWPGLKALLQRQEIMLSLIPLCLCDAASVASLDLHRNQSLLNGAIHKNQPVVFSLVCAATHMLAEPLREIQISGARFIL